jgi:TonB family protein
MQSSVMKNVFKGGFWLSVLLHLLLLLAVLTLMTTPELEKSKPLPHYYVPAYTYTGSIKPSSSRPQSKHTQKAASQPQTSTMKTTEKVSPTENQENIQSVENTTSPLIVPKILKKSQTKKIKDMPIQKSMLAASFDMLKDEQMREVAQKDEAEPIYMIGDDTMPADPLIKMLGRSLSAHFTYPRAAGELGIRGRVILKFTLHPKGYYSNLQMVQSSNNPDLDAAALYAVNAAPKIDGADRFLSKPKTFVVGFLFH